MKIIGHIPAGLAKVVDGLMLSGRLLKWLIKIDGKHRDTPEDKWLSGDGTKIPCIYIYFGTKVHKSNVWEKIKQCKRDLILKKTQEFILLNQTLLIRRFHSLMIFWWAYTRVVKGVHKRDVPIRGWAYTPDLRYLTLGERKPRQKLFYH